jgi:hypothetical protein
MEKIFRYPIVAFFWIVGAGSMAAADFLVGFVSIFFVIVSAAYPDFRDKERLAIYWTIVMAGVVVILMLLYYRGSTEY